MVSGLMHKGAGQRTLALLLAGCLGAPAGCERETQSGQSPTRASARSVALVDFPEQVRADDPEVNAFIERAIRICQAQNYDDFRLLWSALEEPLGEQEFRKGFAAMRKVTILDLLKRRTKEGEIVYLVHCLLQFEPAAVPDPERDVVLLLRQESGQWRVATPPEKEARALKARLAARRQPAGANSNGEIASGTTQP